jgi:hypothetical protein
VSSDHARALDVLRSNATDAVGVDELRAVGIAMPSQVVYELQLAGHNIQRVYKPPGPEGRRILGYRLRSV